MAKVVLIGDIIFNTFLCTPFFSVSSYSLKEVNTIFRSTPGFPVQNKKLTEVQAVHTDNKLNNWYNVNVYSKEVSSNSTNRGPLTLKDFPRSVPGSFNNKLIFAQNDSAIINLEILLQRPTHVKVSVELSEATNITVLQNYFPGWKAYYNDRPIAFFVEEGQPGLTIEAPAGKGIIDFCYEKKRVWIPALLLHLITISFLLYCGVRFIKGHIRSSSPS